MTFHLLTITDCCSLREKKASTNVVLFGLFSSINGLLRLMLANVLPLLLRVQLPLQALLLVIRTQGGVVLLLLHQVVLTLPFQHEGLLLPLPLLPLLKLSGFVHFGLQTRLPTGPVLLVQVQGRRRVFGGTVGLTSGLDFGAVQFFSNKIFEFARHPLLGVRMTLLKRTVQGGIARHLPRMRQPETF